MQGKKLVIHFSAAMTAVYMLSVILVFEMRSIWTSMPKYSRINDLLLMALVGTTVLYILSRKHYTRHFLTGIITTLALCAYLFLYYFYDEYKAESFPKMVLRMCVICLLCFAMREEHKQKLFELIEKIIIVIAVVSLTFWLVGSLLGIIQPSGIEYTIWSSTDGSEVPVNNYYHLYFETQYQHFFTTTIIRNSAIFTEAPMCSFMFCFAFLVELFKKKKYNVKICILLLISIVTCISTTGYVVAIDHIRFAENGRLRRRLQGVDASPHHGQRLRQQQFLRLHDEHFQNRQKGLLQFAHADTRLRRNLSVCSLCRFVLSRRVPVLQEG